MLYVTQDVIIMPDKDISILHNDMTQKNSYFPHPDNKNLKDDGIVQTNTQHPTNLKEQETEGKEETFITNHSDEFGREIKNMPDSDVKIIYGDMESHVYDKPDLKTESTDIDEKAVSKAQQKFMGIVRAIQTGKMKSSEAGSKANDAAKSMSKSDVKDFASTKTSKLPEKVSEDYNDTDQYLLKSAIKKAPINDLLGWSKVNVLDSETDPMFKIETYAKAKGLDLETLSKLAEYYLNNNLGFDGVVQTAGQEILMDLIDELNDSVTSNEPQEQEAVVDESSIIDPSENTMAMSGSNPTSMKMSAPIGTGSQSMETGTNTSGGDSSSPTTESYDMNEISKGKINQKGYEFYLFNKKTKKLDTGWEYKQDAFDAKKEQGDSNDFAVYTKKTVMQMGLNPDDNKSWLNENYESKQDLKSLQQQSNHAKYKPETISSAKELASISNNINDLSKHQDFFEKKGIKDSEQIQHIIDQAATIINNKTNNNINKMDESKELEGYNNELNEFKKVMDGLQSLGEDRKPSALVMLDRLQDQNNKNFNSDFDKSASNDLVKQEDMITDQTNKDTTVVGDKPYTGGENIEEDELKKTDGESFKNVGNSANLKGDEISKRNMTKDEDDEVASLTGGLHTFKYDLDPGKRFEERTKEQMGDRFSKNRELYLKAHDKMNMYHKDQPVTIQKESVTGKYFDFFNKKKLVNFTLNEIKEVEQSIINENSDSYCKIDFDGIGNKYDNLCKNIDESVDSLLTANTFYLNETDNRVVFVKNTVEIINESEVKKPVVVDDNFNKMKHLFNYKSETYMSTKNSKNNRGF